jgi:hypothetical protein
VAEQFLNCPNVVPVFEQMGGETVAERVTAGGLWYASSINCLFHSILQVFFMHMVASRLA